MNGPSLDEREAHGLDLLSTLFEDLRTELAAPSGRRQIEQNRRSLDISHLTAVGSIDNRAVVIDRYLNEAGDPTP